MEGAVSSETSTKLCGITFQDCDLNAQCCIQCIQWQLDFLFLKTAFPLIICTFYWFHQNFHKKNKFSLNVCLCSYLVSLLYIQMEPKLACCCCFKSFQLEIRKQKWFSATISYTYLLCCHDAICIMHCIQCSYPAQMLTLIHSYSRPAKPRPVAVAQLGYSTLHSLLCTKMFATFIQPHHGCPQQYFELVYKVQQE